MKPVFLEQVRLGKNHWWRYVVTMLFPILAIVLVNGAFNKTIKSLKTLVPNNAFGKDVITFILVALVFGIALVAFLVAASRFHQRPVRSFITSRERFDWKGYAIGFFVWAGIAFPCLLLTDAAGFENFTRTFQLSHFLVLLPLAFISLGVQTFFEEVVIRGYWFQGLNLRIKSLSVQMAINAVFFGLLHLGYGIESFLFSLMFGVVFALIVVAQNRIEFVSGAHNANNLILALFFLDLSEATHEQFSWTIDWFDFGISAGALTLLVWIVYKFFRY